MKTSWVKTPKIAIIAARLSKKKKQNVRYAKRQYLFCLPPPPHISLPIVKFGVLLTKLFGRLLLPVVDLSEPDTVVAIKLGTRPPGKFDKSTEKDDLEETGRRDLEGPSNTGVDIRELQVLGRGKVSIKCPLVVVDERSEHGHHRDTAVLALNRTVADELIIVGDVPERVEESKRGGSSNFRGLKESRGGSL